MNPIIRITLRYGAGFLVAKGILSPEGATTLATDPDVLLIAGTIIGAATEVWYAIAKRFGWAS